MCLWSVNRHLHLDFRVAGWVEYDDHLQTPYLRRPPPPEVSILLFLFLFVGTGSLFFILFASEDRQGGSIRGRMKERKGERYPLFWRLRARRFRERKQARE